MTESQWGELPDPVVVRAPAWARVVSFPLMAALWVGCLFGLYGLVTRGAGPDVPWLATAVAWVLVLFLVLLLPFAGFMILSYRLVLGREGMERRPGNTRVAVGELSELRALPASTINRANRGARVQLIDAHGGVIAQIEETAAEWANGLNMVRYWASRHPDLVKDDYTRQRLVKSGD
ncbi:hypothetical protein JNB_19188 [Janibacter sp. HTCC2649]|uniref:hypothetical protein n=1 Tax=Janibacter sp. HTCC2649 TaxID=313589 RepID=UPI0000670FA8|nr:hypothetical protein [Janibacter sp. HTCC2649]EAP97626.1 hypothetical protein JNB_19188 [Janibacter sp. HTCC2649]